MFFPMHHEWKINSSLCPMCFTNHNSASLSLSGISSQSLNSHYVQATQIFSLSFQHTFFFFNSQTSHYFPDFLLFLMLHLSPWMTFLKRGHSAYHFLGIFAFCLSHNSASFLRAGALSGSLSSAFST